MIAIISLSARALQESFEMPNWDEENGFIILKPLVGWESAVLEEWAAVCVYNLCIIPTTSEKHQKRFSWV
jgi:hypothetical protein